MSRVSRRTKYSSMTRSDITRASNKTYINHLEQELNEEKRIREKLERELDDLRRMSSEISSHLGLTNKK